MCEECFGTVNEKKDRHAEFNKAFGETLSGNTVVPFKDETPLELLQLPVIDAVACVFRGDRILLHFRNGLWQFPRTQIGAFETMENAAIRAAQFFTGMTAEFTHMAFAQEHIDKPTNTHTILLYVVGKHAKGLIQTKDEHTVRFFTQNGLKEVVIEPLTAHALAQLAQRPAL
jgi:ADP-ribose pyrophosphatase YjhB (NUDIX family)